MNVYDPPLATYRLQLNHQFRFEDARQLVPYLSRLGITHVYCSPILRARSGSMHGYDVVDPKTVNPELGDENELRAMVTALHAYGIGVIVDIVPNHMAASVVENPYWQNVLMYGFCAPHAHWFDIDWRLADPEMWARVLVPVLGAPLSEVLANDQLCVGWRDGRLTVRYFDELFPLDPATIPMVLRFELKQLEEKMAPGHPAVAELGELLNKLGALPRRATRLRSRVEMAIKEIESWLSRIAQIVASSPQIQQWTEETAAHFGAGKEGRVRLRKLLAAQNYRLVYWRRAATAINYRRFFDIDDLISLRQEDPRVFEETHEALGRWFQDGWVDGFRVDHLDGLRDPGGYVERLSDMISMTDPSRPGHVIFVEKILAHDEQLRASWPIDGTTGYGYLNQIESVLISPAGFAEIEANYRRLLRRPTSFEDYARWGKRRVLRHELSAFVGRLADVLVRLARERVDSGWGTPPVERVTAGPLADDPLGGSDEIPVATQTTQETGRLTKRQLADALVEVAVALPVYRTYVVSSAELHPDDRRYVEVALAGARHTLKAVPAAIDFLEDILLLRRHDELPEHIRRQHLNFIERFQQLTGPAAAKGIEDTALYAYVPLASRSEVGGAPNTPLENAVAVLHDGSRIRSERFPREMLCVTTHDSKRSADVRARLDVLSELPRLWNGYVQRWRRLNLRCRSSVRGKMAPDPAAEYLFYQMIVGIWPATDPRHSGLELPTAETLEQLRDRLEQYMLKAVREAKTRTSWVNGDQQFEEALSSFVRDCLRTDLPGPNAFLNDVNALVARIARPGFWNSLARVLFQYASPGTPDLYQGDELWNFALVDPDNRRAVDYSLRQCLLDEVVAAMETPHSSSQAFLGQLVEAPEDGRLKLHVTHSLLKARREYPQLFAGSSYDALEFEGPRRDHVIGFVRTWQDQAMIAVAARWTASLGNAAAAPIGPRVWSADDVLRLPETLAAFSWKSALTGSVLPPRTREGNGDRGAALTLSEILAVLPVALLVGQRDEIAPASHGAHHSLGNT